jgi:hypothetical protein
MENILFNFKQTGAGFNNGTQIKLEFIGFGLKALHRELLHKYKIDETTGKIFDLYGYWCGYLPKNESDYFIGIDNYLNGFYGKYILIPDQLTIKERGALIQAKYTIEQIKHFKFLNYE